MHDFSSATASVLIATVAASPFVGRSLTTERGPKQRAIKKLD